MKTPSRSKVTHANKQGRIAGMNMVGIKRPFKGITGTSILRFLGLTLGRSGLSDNEADRVGLPHASVTIDASHIASYYPGGKTIMIKLRYHPDTLLVLGGQIIGKAGVDKRVDVLATALFNHMTVMDLEDLDLSYAPPYNSVGPHSTGCTSSHQSSKKVKNNRLKHSLTFVSNGF